MKKHAQFQNILDTSQANQSTLQTDVSRFSEQFIRISILYLG